MNAFHQHLTARFLGNFAIAMVVLTAFRIVMGGAPSQGLPAFLVSALNEALPLALLTATLFTLGLMERNREITALKAAGWPMVRITWPILVAGAAGVVVSSLLGLAGPPGASPGLARSLLCPVAVLLGVGLGATSRAATRYVGFLTALGVLFVYYMVDALFQAFGRHGDLPPVVAGWGATVMLGLVALALFRRAEK